MRLVDKVISSDISLVQVYQKIVPVQVCAIIARVTLALFFICVSVAHAETTEEMTLTGRKYIEDPQNCEAAFNYAVALSKTNNVHDLWTMLKVSRDLAAQSKSEFFAQLVAAGQQRQQNTPNDANATRTLAWACFEAALAKVGADNTEASQTDAAARQRHYYELSEKYFDRVVQIDPTDFRAQTYREYVRWRQARGSRTQEKALRAICAAHRGTQK